ncbi:MAG: GAF domain-containing protein [Magnetospirillum sp.]|nr:GAF domain-containing protein [Magnetospirillum sp.]
MNTIPSAIPCEQEPIHAPGSVQPHVLLVCADPDSLDILAYSDNAADLWPHSAERPFPGRLDGLLPAECLRQIRDARDDGRARHDNGILLELGAENWPPYGAELFLHMEDEVLLCEIEPSQDCDHDHARDMWIVLDAMQRMRDATSLEALSQILCDNLRLLTGMERVLVYRFDKEGHGSVLGESLAADFDESFKGFHFPADDIPAQARTLYLRAPLRFTPSRDYRDSPLNHPINPRSGRPYNLGRCRARPVSPMHRLYQRNLGVDGSFSASIISGGALWGLVVGHHRQSHRVSQGARHRVMGLTQTYALALHACETAEEKDARALHTILHARLLEQIAGADDFVSPLVEGEVKLTDIFFASSGAAVVYDDGSGRPLEVRTVGSAPNSAAVIHLAEFCRRNLVNGVYASDCISQHLPEFADHTATASGVLGISVGDWAQHMIMWFRPETVRTTIWGGKSPCQVRIDKDRGDYLPRQSFERWVEVKRGHSRPWPDWKIEIARSLRTALNDVILRQMRTIKNLNLQLAESDKAKSRFLAHMSHELRTPMNAILGFSELLSMEVYGPLNGRQKGSVDNILEAARHLLSMINDVLDLSKIEAGGFDLNEEKVDLAALCEYSRQLMSSLLREAHVRLDLVLAPDLPPLWADRRMMLQMVINLLSNAIKFTPADGTITIIAARQDDGGLRLEIADSGKGIPPNLLQRVLEPFRQGDDTIDITRRGTGLGLPIVKSLIELHGGTIHLESEPGMGTRVILLFPPERLSAGV